jgi:NAD(P)-dependent dehydrogenase (short-subunit alcohol dehydrogenase family)
MRHEAALRYLDELDAGQGYGLALALHLARCPSCAAVARRAEAALRAYREDTRGAEALLADSRVEDRVMAAVRLMAPPRQDFALRDWLFPAAVIALSMFLLPLFGRDIGFLEALFGSGYALYLSLVLGAGFTAYSALFVATHQLEVRTYLEKRGLMPR